MKKGNNRQPNSKRPRAARPTSELASAPVEISRERKPPIRYGPTFIILEDQASNTFHFKAGVWAAHGVSITEYRATSQVKLLPQQINNMLRYEIRCPL
jgi:hypothetical protein